jgi:hypothetical protein
LLPSTNAAPYEYTGKGDETLTATQLERRPRQLEYLLNIRNPFFLLTPPSKAQVGEKTVTGTNTLPMLIDGRDLGEDHEAKLQGY